MFVHQRRREQGMCIHHCNQCVEFVLLSGFDGTTDHSCLPSTKECCLFEDMTSLHKFSFDSFASVMIRLLTILSNCPGFGCSRDCAVRVSLREGGCCRWESLLQLWDAVARKFQVSKISIGVWDRPLDVANPFNLQVDADSLDISAFRQFLNSANEVLLIRADTHGCTRVPDDGETVFGVHGSLACHRVLQNNRFG